MDDELTKIRRQLMYANCLKSIELTMKLAEMKASTTVSRPLIDAFDKQIADMAKLLSKTTN